MFHPSTFALRSHWLPLRPYLVAFAPASWPPFSISTSHGFTISRHVFNCLYRVKFCQGISLRDTSILLMDLNITAAKLLTPTYKLPSLLLICLIKGPLSMDSPSNNPCGNFVDTNVLCHEWLLRRLN